MLILTGWARAERWQRLGPEGGMVVSLGTSSGADVYLGTADGHVFASTDRAQTWELRGRVGNRLDAVVTRLANDPRDANRVYAAVWYQEAGAGGGVFLSKDGARTWALVGLEGEVVRALEIVPSQPDELVAGTRTGVFRSVDQGKNWERISPAADPELRNVDSIAIDPRDPQVIYVGTYHLPWLTRDAGKTWSSIPAGIIDDSDIMSLRLDVADPQRVFMSACSGIYRSENQGGEWTKLQGIPYAARRTQVIVQDGGSAQTLYAGTTEGLWVTRDGGENWTRTTPKDWVVSGVVILGGKGGGPGRVVIGTESQGVQVSDDAGVSFSGANLGFTHVVVKQLAADPYRAGHLLMMLERNGIEIQESRDDGKTWASVSRSGVAHGKAVRLDAETTQKSYPSPWGWMLRLANGQLWLWEDSKQAWTEWRLALPAAKQRVATSGSVRTTKSEATRLLAPGTTLGFSRDFAFVSTSEGLLRCLESATCTRLKAFSHTVDMRALWVAPAGQEMAVVADGKVGFSSDQGETAAWQDLPVASEQVLWLDVAGVGAGRALYLGTGSGLFCSRDLGVRWKSVEGGLPAGWVEGWLRDSNGWAVTERDGGVYVSEDTGSTWHRTNQDAERSRFTGLVRTASGSILAGSQSEGLLLLETAAGPGVAGNR